MKTYVGHLTAEHREEREKFLPNAFVRTDAINRAIEKDICFVCGRKGAGKTAVAEMLPTLKKDDSTAVFEVAVQLVEDNFKELHSNFFEELGRLAGYREGFGSELEACYYHLWNYILDLSVFQAAMRLPRICDTFPTEIAVVEGYLREGNKGAEVPTDTATLKAVALLTMAKQTQTPTPITMFTLSCKQLRNDRAHQDAQRAAATIFANRTAVVSIDTMEYYDLTGSRVYPLRGLARAVKEFETQQLFRGISVKCFLPAEMTDDLFRDNLAKYNEYAVYLLWSYADLLEFAARRFAILLADHKRQDEADELEKVINGKRPSHMSRNEYWRQNFWWRYFPKTAPNRFRWPEDSCAYLLRHTQKRPREILSCLNFVIDYAIRRREFPKISETALHEGIHDDNNMYQLLSSNLAVFNLPRREKSVADMASQLMADEHTVFSGAYFSRFCRRALSILSTEDNIDRVQFAQDLILRSGLVGRVQPKSESEPAHSWTEGGRECKYYITEFEYLIPGHVSISENSICAVHPILSDRLKIRPPDGDLGVVYPLPETDDLVAGFGVGRK